MFGNGKAERVGLEGGYIAMISEFGRSMAAMKKK